jgi:hypothetical protein
MLFKIAKGGEIPEGFRHVISEYMTIAGIYKEETARMLASLEGRLDPRYMLSLQIIFHLYTKIYDRIDPENGSFTTEELNPTPEEIRESVLECISTVKKQKLQFLVN